MNKQELQKALVEAVTVDYIDETGDQNPTSEKIQKYIEQKGGDKYLQDKLKSLTKKAAHGAKLEYISKLKSPCNEGETLEVYKRGGQLCTRCIKAEQGGVPVKKNPNWTMKDEKELDSLKTRESKKLPLTIQGKKRIKFLTNKFAKAPNRAEYDSESWFNDKVSKKKYGSKIKVSCGGTKVVEKGGKICPKCGKIHPMNVLCETPRRGK